MGKRWFEWLGERLRRYALPIVQTLSAIVNIVRFIRDFFDL